MQIVTHINNAKCLEWGINANQGALFDMLNQVASWAKPIVIDGHVWYWVSRNKVIDELPLYYSKPDTVYRHLKALAEKNLIGYKKDGEKDLIMLTEKGKTWNNKVVESSSEINPTLGNKSENTRIEIRNSSDSNPTYQHTNTSAVEDQKDIAPDGECVSHETALKIISDYKKPRFSKSDLIYDFGINKEVAESYLEVRTAKKSPLTKLAFKKLVNQAKKAELTIEQVMTTCAEKNWVGFEASWLKQSSTSTGEKNISTEFEDWTSPQWGLGA